MTNAFDEAMEAPIKQEQKLSSALKVAVDQLSGEVKRLKQLIVDYREAKQPWGSGDDSHEKCPQCQKYYMKKGIKRCESCVNADINAALAKKPRSGAGKPEVAHE